MIIVAFLSDSYMTGTFDASHSTRHLVINLDCEKRLHFYQYKQSRQHFSLRGMKDILKKKSEKILKVQQRSGAKC